MDNIAYGKQSIDSKDIRLVSKSLKSNLITTGNYVEKFEYELKKYLRAKYVVTCTSGTAALDLSIRSLGLSKGDVVIMPAVNFIASYSICSFLGAKIYLSDVDPLAGQITPEFIETCIKKNKIKKIKLIICMQMGGYLRKLEELYKIKKKYKCYLLDDACHALGAKYKSKDKLVMMGSCTYSDISVFSLHPVKTITTGEGGIISTNNKKIYDKSVLLRSHGIIRNKNKFHWKYDIKNLGLNYRLSDINCALGISQLSKIEKFIDNRSKCFNNYVKLLNNYKKIIKIPNCENKNLSSFHLFLLNIDFKKIKKTKNNFFKFMKKNNIICQYHYIPIYKFGMYKGKKEKYENSEKYFNNTVSLPIFSNLQRKQQRYIVKKIIEFIK